ncbi:hypothetical protein [Stenotrophomonas indicatrix]|uniref:hypothetical protein n=1 Tax=Stenotrophomonas indicatrix TaxID=2045451 RepID=UPI00073975BE|nr:hypothetical protein [Stenotrophomonas indicatrix]CRD45803.1 conserved hypothetical protein [Stenotrophomonas indicatrix]
MGKARVSLEEALHAVTAANAAVWQAIAGYRYMTDVHDKGEHFELTIFGDMIVSKPFPGLAIDWRYTVHPERLPERAQEVVRYTARQAIMDTHDAVWKYLESNRLKDQYLANPVLVLLRALRLAYAHRADDWQFKDSPLPLQWRQLQLVAGMNGKSVSETMLLSDQLYLMNDAIHLLDPNNPLVAPVQR